MAIKWGLSVLDRRRHAVDEHASHPIGVLKAQCGHLLLMVTELDPEPLGSRCKSYAAMQPAGARRVTSASVSR
jgi:hypothetical protein